MIVRVDSITDFLDIPTVHSEVLAEFCLLAKAAVTGKKKVTKEMKGYHSINTWKYPPISEDLRNLVPILSFYQPRRIFEFSTYLGLMTEFMLRLSPTSEITTLEDPFVFPFELSGYHISPENKDRCTEIFVDYNELYGVINDYQKMDMIFIGNVCDHSEAYVSALTSAARQMVKEDGIIIWHGVASASLHARRYLHCNDNIKCIAPPDDGNAMLRIPSEIEQGIALWSKDIQKMINRAHEI
jgi:predicted O-methyltransferase YrrM